jgi:hypothetical protein
MDDPEGDATEGSISRESWPIRISVILPSPAAVACLSALCHRSLTNSLPTTLPLKGLPWKFWDMLTIEEPLLSNLLKYGLFGLT